MSASPRAEKTECIGDYSILIYDVHKCYKIVISVSMKTYYNTQFSSKGRLGHWPGMELTPTFPLETYICFYQICLYQSFPGMQPLGDIES